jgi:NAD(P)-dependent dehydrogenase (short-subunit alcohol dehydrogenase family)
LTEHLPISELTSLRGKGAIITGGAIGLGRAMAERFVEAGASVFIADLDAEAARTAAAELTGQGFTAFSAGCDVSREDEVITMVDAAARDLDSVDILVNNAGIYPCKPLEEMTGGDFERVTGINLTGTFLCSRYVAPVMKKQQRGGCIINLASIEALHPSAPGMTAYDASKGGVLMLTKSLARELGRENIRVNAIAPGAILTRAMYTQVGEKADPAARKAGMKQLKAFMSRMALGRMGDADDIARVALFLASEMSAYITGEVIVVDGGYLIS